MLMWTRKLILPLVVNKHPITGVKNKYMITDYLMELE